MDVAEIKSDVTRVRVLPTAVGRNFAALAVSPASQIEAILGFLSLPSSYTWMTDAIAEIARTPQYLEELGPYAYEHPNGFDQLPLELNSPQYRARLHIWWPDRTGTIEDIHNHAWDFGSRILCGSLRFTTFEAGDEGVPHYHCYYPIGSKNTPKQADDRIVALRKTFDGHLPAEMSYSFSHTQLHRVKAEGDGRPVATLVVSGVRQRAGSDIFYETRRNEGHRPMVVLGPDKLRQRLERLLEELSLHPASR